MICRGEFGLRSDDGGPLSKEEYERYKCDHPEEFDPSEDTGDVEEEDTDLPDSDDDFDTTFSFAELEAGLQQSDIPKKVQRAILEHFHDIEAPQDNEDMEDCDRFLTDLWELIDGCFCEANPYEGTRGVASAIWMLSYEVIASRGEDFAPHQEELQHLAQRLDSISGKRTR